MYLSSKYNNDSLLKPDYDETYHYYLYFNSVDRNTNI